MTIDVGEPIDLTLRTTDSTGALADPGTVSIDIVRPDGTLLNIPFGAIDHPGVGTFHYALVTTQAGGWSWTWNASGGDVGIAVEEGFTYVGAAGDRYPCGVYATVEDVLAIPAYATLNPVLIGTALQAASAILYRLSGRQFPGLCEDSVYPTHKARPSPIDAPPVMPGGIWRPWRSYPCAYCGQPEPAWIALPATPVRWVREVVVAGVALPATAYEVWDRRYLLRVDGQGWPWCANLATATAWRVDYLYGREVDIDGRMAAAEYAGEIALGWARDDACRLPRRITTITRQGITMTVLDPLQGASEGRTMVPNVDLWLSSVNPGRIRRPAVFASPDTIPTAHRRT